MTSQERNKAVKCRWIHWQVTEVSGLSCSALFIFLSCHCCSNSRLVLEYYKMTLPCRLCRSNTHVCFGQLSAHLFAESLFLEHQKVKMERLTRCFFCWKSKTLLMHFHHVGHRIGNQCNDFQNFCYHVDCSLLYESDKLNSEKRLKAHWRYTVVWRIF